MKQQTRGRSAHTEIGIVVLAVPHVILLLFGLPHPAAAPAVSRLPLPTPLSRRQSLANSIPVLGGDLHAELAFGRPTHSRLSCQGVVCLLEAVSRHPSVGLGVACLSFVWY